MENSYDVDQKQPEHSAKIAVYPGSFDPMHKGHLDIIQRASMLFDQVLVVVATNSAKSPSLSVQERLCLVQEAVKGLPNVVVKDLGPQLVMDLCKKYRANFLVKGLRNSQDFDYEIPQAAANHSFGSIETVFLASRPEYSVYSSTIIREVAGLGGEVDEYVPPNVAELYYKNNS